MTTALATTALRNWLDIGGGIFLGLFALAITVFDRYLSTRPSRDLLIEYLRTLRGGAGNPKPTDATAAAAWQATVTALDTRLDDVQRCAVGAVGVRAASADPLVATWWTRVKATLRPISATKVLSAWRDAHQIEGDTWALATADALKARLAVAAAECKAVPSTDPAAGTAAALAERITTLLTPPAAAKPATAATAPVAPAPSTFISLGKGWVLQRQRPAGPGAPAAAGGAPATPATGTGTTTTPATPAGPSTAELCAVLQQALRFLADRRDTQYETLASRQTQSVWLAMLALALIVIAAVATGRQPLFVFGALGAFISRLARVQSAGTHDNDYGVSSGALYLSMAAGAIAGWVGVLVTNALALPDVHVLGKMFDGIWDHPLHVLPAGVAVAFGFSERLLNKVLSQAADTIGTPATSSTGTTAAAGGSAAATTTAPPPAPPSPPAAPSGAAAGGA